MTNHKLIGKTPVAHCLSCHSVSQKMHHAFLICIQSEEEGAQLSRINMTLDEVHILEKSTRQQLSAKWKESKVTASHFGQVLLHWLPPSEPFINSFFDTRQHSTTPAPINHTRQHVTTPAPINHTRQHVTTPAPINHGLQNEIKANNAYCSKTGFVTHTCGLVVNPSLP